jgi:DNA primase large subunit
MKEINLFIKKASLFNARSLYDLMAECGDISSPVARKMLKTRQEFDLSRSDEELDAKTSWRDRIVKREALPDIEDLGTKSLVPPCMQRIFTAKIRTQQPPPPPHLGHTDRLNAVRYLIDMAYTKEEAVGYLCRSHEKDREYVLAIETAYDSFSRLKRANPDGVTSQHHSFYCGSIINLKQQHGNKNVIRCVFAEKAEQRVKSHRRCDYTVKEKEVFRQACSDTLCKKPFFPISHPIQYSLLQMSSSSSSSS